MNGEAVRRASGGACGTHRGRAGRGGGGSAGAVTVTQIGGPASRRTGKRPPAAPPLTDPGREHDHRSGGSATAESRGRGRAAVVRLPQVTAAGAPGVPPSPGTPLAPEVPLASGVPLTEGVVRPAEGVPLTAWVASRLRRGGEPGAGPGGEPGVGWPEAARLAAALAGAVARAHAEGLVLSRLTAAEVLVGPSGEVDLTAAGPVPPGTPVPASDVVPITLEEPRPQTHAFAGGYRSSAGSPPSPADGRPRAALHAVRPGELPPGWAFADARADLCALGGLLFLLATGHEPLLPALPPALPAPTAGVPDGEHRLRRWLTLAERTGGETARRLRPLITALRAPDPSQRPTAAAVAEAVATTVAEAVETAVAARPAPASPLPASPFAPDPLASAGTELGPAAHSSSAVPVR